MKSTSSAVTSASSSVSLPDWFTIKAVTSSHLLLKEFSKAVILSMRFNTNGSVLIWGSMMNCTLLDVTWALSSAFSHPNSVGGSRLEVDFMGGDLHPLCR